MPQNWEQEFRLKLHNVYSTIFQGSLYDDKQLKEKADVMVDFIKQIRQQDNEELIKNIENLIQKERFAGAPYALSQVQELINSYYKQ